VSDDAPDRLGCYDQIRAFFGSTAMIFIGCFVLFGPEKVRHEIPEEYRGPIAYGAIAFGVLFGVTAIYASGRSAGSQAVAARFKGLLLATVGAVVLWFAAGHLGTKLRGAHHLAERGVPTAARVLRHSLRFAPKGKATFTTEISYRGGLRATLKGKLGTPGGTTPVLYLDDEPSVMLPGTKGDDFLTLLDRDPGHGTAALLAGTSVLFTILIPWGLWRLIAGSGSAGTAG